MYAVVLDANGRVALVQENALYLPGGGIEGAESLEEALLREIREECGCGARVLRPLGAAVEFVETEELGPLEIQAEFFEAEFVGTPAVTWVRVTEAFTRVARRSHVWAIQISVTRPNSE